MIKEFIKKYDAVKYTLGKGADTMDVGTVARSEFIDVMKGNLTIIEKGVAMWMHDNYEQIAKGENWNTQESCKVEFKDLPKENQNVMIELAKRILN